MAIYTYDEELKHLEPFSEFIGVQVPTPQGVFVIGSSEFARLYPIIIRGTFAGYANSDRAADETESLQEQENLVGMGPLVREVFESCGANITSGERDIGEVDRDIKDIEWNIEQDSLYFDLLWPRIQSFAETYIEVALVGETVRDFRIYDYCRDDRQDFFARWMDALIDHLSRTANIMDDGANIYFIKYQGISNLLIPQNKAERREFLESTRLFELRFYKVSKKAIVRNLFWYSLLYRDYRELQAKLSRCHNWIALFVFILFVFIVIRFF